ncbi:MAG: TaqI-like C-terminal specificity domain-containing protein [Candidatus Kryptoniota bacterium]
MEQAYESVKKLVEYFRAHERDYLSPTYQESQVRQDFIDKFFTALGWDVTHERQKNPHEYEVQIEKNVQGSTQQKADYAFFLAPNFRDPKFYVEAKKPARELKNPDFFYQTMRYGWNGNTPIAILTDFEEFYIIDCRAKPTIKDALTGEIKSFHYTDYADEEKFKWIYWLFSHEAVANGSIEKFLGTLKKAKGKAVRGAGAPVDEVFLAELDGYRENLAKGFKKSNQELDGEELTEAVQRTVDRLVFIRFLEDKLIEEKEIASLINRQMAWELFVGYCKRLDPKYNGLIFKPHRIDNKDFNSPDKEVFQEICNGLAGRESPYNFAQIPISILGSIYERFLGKVVHATDKRVKVEEKPEVRKAGGVYYTPDYIVRYIVKETVGKLIEGKTPEEISKMAFADIACGSGSFLIEVYDLLLKYHESYYSEHPDRAKKADLENREGRKVLSLKKRQEILVNNIYGVDIDYQATEVTQLSLYLKLLEDVTTNDAYQFSLLKEKILPNLNKNIVCGNSLIGRDITEGNIFPDVDESKLKPMNFKDVFPEVMNPLSSSGGGFDAVVGNPPYVRAESLETDFKDYAKKVFSCFSPATDLYAYFYEKGLAILKKDIGFLGFISSNKFMRSGYGAELRKLLKGSARLLKILDFGELPVFQEAATFPAIIIMQNRQTTNQEFTHVAFKSLDFASLDEEVKRLGSRYDNTALGGDYWSLVGANLGPILERIRAGSIPLQDYLHSNKIYRGILTGLNQAFVIDSKTRQSIIGGEEKSAQFIKPFAVGDDIRKYSVKEKAKYVIVVPKGWTNEHKPGGKNSWEWFKKEFAELARHLMPFEAEARKRLDKGDYWWELRACDYYEEFSKSKIVYPDIAKESRASFDTKGIYLANTAYFIPSNDLYLLALLNSNLIFNYYKRNSAVLGDADKGGRLRWFTQDVLRLPIHVLGSPHDKEIGDHIVQLVERMLATKEELSKAKTEAETTRLQRECEALDRQIDQAVYELYGLTEEEVRVVEGKI